MNKNVADKDRVMRARWVLTWKSTGKAEARLSVLGVQDPDLTEVPRDSPTLSPQAEAFVSQFVASNKRKLVLGVIKTTFLSEDEGHRNIFILPPDDARDICEAQPRVNTRKAVFGLVNAPKTWWDRLKRSLLNHGFASCALDPCAIVLVKQKQIRGVTGVHVDDLLGGSDEMLERTILGSQT